MYHKTPIIFVETIVSVQFQGKIEKSAVQNVTNSKACPQQVKRSSFVIELTMAMALLAVLNNKPQK
jgi:hypothetical protein